MATLRLALTIALLTVILPICISRQIRQAPRIIKSAANLTIEEIEYILKSKYGEAAEKPKRLTPCARAILGCCHEDSMNVECSEKLNCGAHFFDDNPCDEKFLRDALKNADSFYSQFNPNKKLSV